MAGQDQGAATPNLDESFVAEAVEAHGKLAYCDARIERVVRHLEINETPDRELLLRLLSEALRECRRDW